MKKSLQKLSARASAIIYYTLFTGYVGGTLCVLLFLLLVITPGEEWRWLYAFYVGMLIIMLSLGMFLAGLELAKLRYAGRAVGPEKLIMPGTALPQCKSFFFFRGAHTLGGGWVIATFQKVEKEVCVSGPPNALPIKDLFCVLTRKEALPQGPCLLRFELDQHQHIAATELPMPAPRLN